MIARASDAAQTEIGRVLQPPAGTFDFSRRMEPEDAPEWMDQPCSYEEFRACLRDLGSVNRVTLAYRPTLDFVARAAAKHAGQQRPLRILDVGSGGGDTLRRIARWAARKGIAVELTGVDLNPHAAKAAREFDTAGRTQCLATPDSGPPHLPRRWADVGTTIVVVKHLTADAFSLPTDLAPDIILSSLFTHHLPSRDVVRFLVWMEATARSGWFVNDLLRSRRSYRLFALLSRAARWHKFVQHDGPVSIRRAFDARDWRGLCTQAGLPESSARIVPWFPGRLCVERLK